MYTLQINSNASKCFHSLHGDHSRERAAVERSSPGTYSGIRYVYLSTHQVLNLDLDLAMVLLGGVLISIYGCYGPTPASKTNHFFGLLISRPSSCVRPESVKNSFDGF